MLASDVTAEVARSREALLAEIGAHPDLTFMRGIGNRGDELIWAGTRELLSGHVYREIGVDELASSEGDVVVLAGSGAFSRAYHEWMPRALAVAELRFDRVIVLPSSFDPGEDAVRRALERTSATVFAREPESLRRIEGLCRARFAYDCAFFFDFSPWRGEPGEGTLNAFRTDREAAGHERPVDDDDISVTCASLDDWLATIARHAVVRTDRAHVMIAAALLGKEVEYASGSWHKVEALAAELGVRRISPARARPLAVPAVPVRDRLRAAAAPPPPPAGATVAAVVLTRQRPGLAEQAVRSVLAQDVPLRVLLIDNNSGTTARQALTALAEEDERVDLRLSDRNLGCAGGRRLATEVADAEYVLFLDDDAELAPGALGHLVADLEAHPDASAVTALVVDRDGRVQHYGGWVERSADRARFAVDGEGLAFDDPGLPATGTTGWAPGTAVLVRASVLEEVPIDERMAVYYEDNDWCLRVELRRPGSFRRCREALALHHRVNAPFPGSRFVVVSQAAERLAAQAHFLAAHGVLLDVDLLEQVPELRLPDGTADLPAARLLLELVGARGTDWLVAAWMSGALDPLIERGRLHDEADALRDEVVRLGDWVAHLERGVAERDAGGAALEERLADATREVERMAVNYTQAREWIDQLVAEREELRARLAYLDERHATLVRIEQGGWWRLRGRLRRLVGRR